MPESPPENPCPTIYNCTGSLTPPGTCAAGTIGEPDAYGPGYYGSEDWDGYPAQGFHANEFEDCEDGPARRCSCQGIPYLLSNASCTWIDEGLPTELDCGEGVDPCDANGGTAALVRQSLVMEAKTDLYLTPDAAEPFDSSDCSKVFFELEPLHWSGSPGSQFPDGVHPLAGALPRFMYIELDPCPEDA